MMDPYEKMISRPGFWQGERVIDILSDHVFDSELYQGIYSPQEKLFPVELFPVEGLAVAFNGIMRTYVDIPNMGRVTCNNPIPPVYYLQANPTGYKELQMSLI